MVNNFTVQEDNWKYWEAGNTFLNKNCHHCNGNMMDKNLEQRIENQHIVVRVDTKISVDYVFATIAKAVC